MQTTLSALQKNTRKKLDRLSAAAPTGEFGVSPKLDQRLALWSAKEVSELYLGLGTAT